MLNEVERSGNWVRAFPLVLLLSGVLAYVNTLPNEFVFDDTYHIVRDHSIRDLADLPGVLGRTQRPLVKLSLAINYAIEGLKPPGYHLLNMMVHVAASWVLFGVVGHTLRQPIFAGRFRSSAPWLALAVSLLWLLHPLNTQAVTYVIQRGESMMGLFYLLTLYGAIRFGDSGRVIWAFLSVGTCLLGVACKPVIAGAPLVVVLYDYTFRRDAVQLLLRRIPFYAGLALTWIPLWWLLSPGLSAPKPAFGFGLEAVKAWEFALTQPLVLLKYLRLCFVPNPLVLDYMHPASHTLYEVDPPVIATLKIAWPVLVVLTLVLVSAWGLWRRLWWGFLGACFFLILAPTSSVVPVADLMVEHRMYLPLVTVVSLVVIGAHGLMEKRVRAQGSRLGLVLVMAVAVALGWLTIQRNRAYRTEISIWKTVVDARPHNPRALVSLGTAYDRGGDDRRALSLLKRAIDHDPTCDDAHNNMGKIYLERGQLGLAIERFEMALKSAPDDPEYHQNLGKAQLLAGDLDAAEQSLRRALELRPDYGKAHAHLGLLELARGRREEAIGSFRLAIEHDPELIEPYQNLAILLKQMGRTAEAAEVYRKGSAVAPHYPNFLIQWARILASAPEDSLRDGSESLRLLERAQQVVGGQKVLYLDTLAAAWAELDRFDDAVAAAGQAIKAAQDTGLPGDVIRQIDKRRDLYRAGRPYREWVGESEGASTERPG